MPQNIIVTGCASGIGKHLAGRLYEAGHRLLLTDLNEDGLRAAASGFDDSRVLLRRLDVRNAAEWSAIVDEAKSHWGTVDVVINVAGVLSAVWTYEAAPSDVDLMMDVNAKGLMYGTNAALKVMVAQKSGHVINVASLAGVVPVPGLAIYSASKHAARAYSIAAGIEVREHDVHVSVICPTVVATPMMDEQMHREEAALTFSTKRPLTVDEVASAIIDRVMIEKPLELLLDVPGTGQAFLSRLGNLFPGMTLKLRGRLSDVGRANQGKWRAS